MMRMQQKIALATMLLWINFGRNNAVFSPVFGVIKTEKPSSSPSPNSLLATARSCSHQSECAGISGSSCVRTPYDSATRCLCGDNSPPVNGQCEAQTKSLYHVCATSDECGDELICGVPNITSTAPAHLYVHSPQEKICLCDTDSGFKEKDHACSDADILRTSLFAIIIFSCLRKLFQ
ncbi:uncharacterized protein LOC114244452 isoform X2 [Bombyx mandarina]|uniref:Uncharacterized protein LOC114244452 isoform X2 n=1 Tax=Bombyx mandarina TaxID=7092 RepID=A0A6J2JV52_BOMMA|nr:uncharacterized protein LOC114244452 isoform X2 [Bombyx mandarina]